MKRLSLALFLAAGSVLAAPKASPVTTVAVQAVEWHEQVTAQGAIAAWQEATVANRVPGVAVVEIRASVGDYFKKGALLARLDDRAIQAELQRAEAERDRARTALQQAEAEAQRSQILRSGGSVSEQELLAANTGRDLARSQLKGAEAALRSLLIRLEDTRLLAPDDGLITARSAVLGQVPQQGAELFRMIRQDRLEWRAELPPEQLARLQIGSIAKVQLPDGKSVRGKLRQLAGTLDASSRLGIAYVDLPPGHSARAGMHVAGTFELARSTGMAIPAEAIQVRDGRAVVYRVEEGRAQQVGVQTARREGGFVEVQGALKVGDRVVVQGAGFLRNGEVVREAKP